MDSTLILAIAAVVAAVFALSWSAWQFISPERTAADRLAEFTGGQEREALPTRLNAITRSAARLSKGSDSELVQTRKWLVQGGFRQRNAVEVYSASRTVGLVALAVLGLLLVIWVQSRGHDAETAKALAGNLDPASPVTTTQRLRGLVWYLFGLFGGATLGYYAPYLYVQNTVQKRKERILAAFPDALDLLVSAVEAGLGLDAGFRRVAEEMEIAAPELSLELQLVNHEVTAGVPRVDALRRLDERVGIDDVSSLVNVLIQAERFGSSVSRALRVHSGHIRIKRMQRAETKAAQVSPKLTVVMIIFILPTLLIVLLGPAVVKVKNILIPTAQERGAAP